MSDSASPIPFEPLKLVGATVDGRYRLTGHLATGGMGAVFRAEHVYMRKELALKVLRSDLSASPDIVERFRREAEIAASLDHANIVRVSDFGRSPEGHLFLAMELLEGESLFDRLRGAGPMSPEEAIPILVQVCSALDAAHRRGVVHRDLKPENIFLARTGDDHPLAKILDFGIAKLTDPATHTGTQSGMVVGTPEYLSPEQALGNAVDGRADVYAVGLIAWRMLAGRHPFKADDARALLMMQATRPVPPLTEARRDLVAYPALVAAVARACAKAPADRHATAADLGWDLAASIGLVSELPSRTPVLTGEVDRLPPATPHPDAAADARTRSVLTPFSIAALRADARLFAARGAAQARRGILAARTAGLRAWGGARRHPRGSAAALAALAGAGIAAAALYATGTPAARARDLLAHGRADAARAVIESALQRREGDVELRALLGRALHALGRPGPGLDAYEVAFEKDAGAVDADAFSDLGADLGRERRIADRAAHLLVRGGRRAVPTVLAAATQGSPVARLRALDLVRDLGAEAKIDRVAGYAALLADPDCDLRRIAARRLGDLGNASALPKLRELAQSREQTHGFLGIAQSAPVCGAAEALAATRRIEASARRP